MAIAFVQATSANATTVSSLTTPAISSGLRHFFAAAVADGNRTISGTPVTDSLSNTWANSWVSNGGSSHGALYYVTNALGGSSHTFTFTPQGGTDQCAIAVAEFDGVTATGPLDGVSSAASAAAPHTSGSVSTSSSAQLLLGCGSSSNQSVHDPASSPGFFTDFAAIAGGGTNGLVASYAIVDETGQYTYQYGYAGGNEGCGIATFKGTSITYVQAKSVNGLASSITTPAMASTSGHFIAAVGQAFLATFSGSPITDSQSNTWANAWTLNSGVSGHSACYYAMNITGGASHTVTQTIASFGANGMALAVGEFSGIDTSSALDKVASASSSAEPQSSGSTATTSQANELLIGGGGQSHSGAIVPFSVLNGDWTDAVSLRHVVSGSIQGIILSYRIVPVSGAYSYAFADGVSIASAVGIATFKASDPTVNDPLRGVQGPLFYCELQTGSSTVSYSWVDQPINETTIQRLPQIVNISTLRRELSDDTGRLAINHGTVTLTDYDGAIATMIAAGSILRKQIDFYAIDDANRRLGGIPFRVGQYLITQYKRQSDFTVILTFEDRFGGDSLRDLLTKPLPVRKFDSSFNSTLPAALLGKGQPIPYGVLSDETSGYPTVQVWYTGDRDNATLGGTWYEGFIAGCATGLPISAWGWDGGTVGSDGTHFQVKLSSSVYDSDIAMPGQGSLWGFWSSTPYRVINGQRCMVMYLRAGSAVGEDFKAFATGNTVAASDDSHGVQPVPVHVNLSGIETVGDSTGSVITSLPRQWQHLITNFVEQNHHTDANWYDIPETENGTPYAVIDVGSVEQVKVQSEARVSGGVLGAFIIGFDLERVPLGDVLQRICLGGDFDMGIDRHGRAFVSMEDPTVNPVRDFTILDVLEGTYQVDRAWDRVVNSITFNTFKNLTQTNASVTLRPSSPPQPSTWLTGVRNYEDGTSVTTLGGDPAGRREMVYEDWVTRDVTLVIPNTVAAHKLSRFANGQILHQFETDLGGLDVELGDLFTITHDAGLLTTTRTVRCTAIECEPPDPFTKRWAVRLFGYEVGGASATALVTLSVSGGSGSGVYAVGATVAIVADPPPTGYAFSAWSGATVTSSTSSSTTIVMPAHSVYLRAVNVKLGAGILAISGAGAASFVGTSTASAGVLTIAGAGAAAFAGTYTTDGLQIAGAGAVTFVGVGGSAGALAATGVGTLSWLTRSSGQLAVTGVAAVAWNSGVAPGHLNVAWDASVSASVVGYIVQWGTTPGVYPNSRDAGNVLAYTITGLVGGTTYYVSVESYTASAYSGASSETSGVAS
jgi:hypothetical protein